MGGIHYCGATVPNWAHPRPNLPAHQNHTPTKLDNSSYRFEYFNEEGQRTDVKTAYIETSSLYRWFSPEVEIRPGATTRVQCNASKRQFETLNCAQ
jgi:hypothetical protein